MFCAVSYSWPRAQTQRNPRLLESSRSLRPKRRRNLTLDRTQQEAEQGEANFPFDDAMSFSEGLARVKVGDKWGYIDTTD